VTSRVSPVSLIILALGALILCVGVGAGLVPGAEAGEMDSTFNYREAFLPPGVPSVAMRFDETAILWNPAGMALSRTYYMGFAWKGTYLDDDRQVATKFYLVKARGFGLGFIRDDVSPGTRTATLFSLAPHVTDSFAVGFTGKWKGGFNFDCGALYKYEDRLAVGVVGRNLRDTKDVRRYIESGIAVTAVPHRLALFFDVINEESPWRDALAYGGGLTARLEYGINATISYSNDGEGHETYRGSLNFIGGNNIIEGEYSTSTDHWYTLAGRIASRSQ
jgi:hypothetical protein